MRSLFAVSSFTCFHYHYINDWWVLRWQLLISATTRYYAVTMYFKQKILYSLPLPLPPGFCTPSQILSQQNRTGWDIW